MLNYETLSLGDLGTNCYLVWDENSKKTIVIDPADEGVELAQEIQARGLKLEKIVLTHGHYDHCLGALDLKLIFQVPIAMNSDDLFLLKRQRETSSFWGIKNGVPNINKVEIDLKKVDEIIIGEEILKIIQTPGHTPGSISLWYKKGQWLWGGDLVFAEGSVGETHHSYSNKTDLKISIKKILKLPRETLILPGHGETTTVAAAREYFV